MINSLIIYFRFFTECCRYWKFALAFFGLMAFLLPVVMLRITDGRINVAYPLLSAVIGIVGCMAIIYM